MDIQTIKLRYGIIGNDPKLLLAINKAIQVAPTPMAYSGDPADESMCQSYCCK